MDIVGKKFWEIKYLLDMMEFWKFGDWKFYIFFKLLVVSFGFLFLKDDIDGSMVGCVFWEDNDIDCIVYYCEKDVLVIV